MEFLPSSTEGISEMRGSLQKGVFALKDLYNLWTSLESGQTF